MGSDKTKVWNVKWQRGLWVSPEANQKALATHARSECIYLGQLFSFTIIVIPHTRRTWLLLWHGTTRAPIMYAFNYLLPFGLDARSCRD